MTGRQATRMRQKYKDSCTHCAGAKVRCSKEKPQCMRCNERGLECSYGLSYRYGRLPARTKLNDVGCADHIAITAPNTPRELLPNGSRTPSPASGSNNVPFSWLADSSLPVASHTDTATLDGCLNMNYDSSTSHNFITTPYDGINASLHPMQSHNYQTLTPTSDPIVSTAASYNGISYIPCLDTLPSSSGNRRTHSRSVSSVSSSLPSGFDYPVATFQNTSPISFGTPPETPRTRTLSNYVAASQHDCLLQATTTLLSLRNEPILLHGSNRDLMDQILHMVECDCFSKDSHQRMLLVLIGFEVMTRYSLATQGGRPAPSAEILIENLQAVLKLIERLLRRLRESEVNNISQGFAQDPVMRQSGNNTISYAVFGQLEADLRKQLRGISHNTVDVLRRT
ncbi:hypothetical protein GGR57DRAFT_220233 [Xylariaceae sp. FL1272]|nr:hypothetical protein GGR57DRAFT_220233 [Xylariaceae sp. FL1272]